MTKSVMIVDDHPAIRVAIRALLSQSNEFTTIYESVDGSEALEILKNNPVDLVIIDIELPNFDGFSLLKKLQQRGFTGKSLFLSAKNEQVLRYAHYKLEPTASSVKIKILAKFFLPPRTYYVGIHSSPLKP